MSDEEKVEAPDTHAGGQVDRASGEDTGGADAERRRFLANASRAMMTAGIIGGYGGFGLIAGRYLYPARPTDRIWQYVAIVDSLGEAESMRYQGPSGETINVVRMGRTGDTSDFIALSSTCPHLGCQVHWEPQNERYFCPCHNGTFDPAGVATGGPPGDAGQSLPRYPLRIEGGLLYIEVPAGALVADPDSKETRVAGAGISAPGHDRCLEPDKRSGSGNKA